MKKLFLFPLLALALHAQTVVTAPLGKSINLTWNDPPSTPLGGLAVVQEQRASQWVDVYSTAGYPSWTTTPAAGAHLWHVIIRLPDGRESPPSNEVSVTIVEIVAPTPTPTPTPLAGPTNLVLKVL